MQHHDATSIARATFEPEDEEPSLKPLGSLNVVLTGASSGIGRATALAFAAKGASLVLASRHREHLQEVAQACEG
jgi:NADPH:quinone reductase-like Zn-dependent oxidoreductase